MMLLSLLVGATLAVAAPVDKGPYDRRVYGTVRAGGPPLFAALQLETDSTKRRLHTQLKGEVGIGTTEYGPGIAGGMDSISAMPI